MGVMIVGIDPDLDESGKAQRVCSRIQRSRLDSCYVCHLAVVRPAAFGIITLEVTPARALCREKLFHASTPLSVCLRKRMEVLLLEVRELAA